MPKSLGLVALLALLWGASFPILKVAVETIPPITVAASRALLGGLLLLAVLGREAPSLWRSGIPLRSYVVQSTFNCILPWILVAWASTSIDAALTTILNSLSPIFIFLLTWAITRHEAATARKFVGVMLGIAGVLAIVGPDAMKGFGRNTLAELACVAGSLAYAIAAIVGRRFDKVSPLVPSAGSVLVAAAVLIPLALIVEQPWTARPSWASVLAVVAGAVFSTAGAFIVYFRLLATIGSIATASQAYLRILVGVGLGVIFLGERLTAGHFVGLALVFAGVVAMTLPGRGTVAR
ncbi:MAG TPA: DMT family transporter [Usitatibacter sp.]|nr:DMT family transporter [Usitatibacter sp.]